MIARSHRGGDGEVRSKVEHADAWDMTCWTFLSLQFPYDMTIKLCIGDLSSMLGHRGKSKLIKAVGLQVHDLVF